MSQKYSGETREILADFLQALQRRADVEPAFVAELAQLVGTGSLGNPTKVKQAVRMLETRIAEEGRGEHED